MPTDEIPKGILLLTTLTSVLKIIKTMITMRPTLMNLSGEFGMAWLGEAGVEFDG